MLQQQYDFVLYSRNTILEYIKTISAEDFVTDNSTFGRGSIRNLLVHICDTYSAWIGERALGYNINYASFETYKHLDDCINYFSKVDGYMHRFFEKFKSDYELEIDIFRNGETLKISPLRLFTHVITHEFHHKGQIMSLSRHLGYTPVDADIIR
ncbi:damage-inducible protein DinB [Pedobacter chinensis]|uniref:Damage-inducible protein DinB n=1 Tax=Pedobacter chinensis TaxID=2282421 RepID=A0A369PYE3_9SPHI|nr:DinB family protein [Pedobacter chinensis]RDC57282.1 damage-inducible protein DinB [Pedobacter chinensis]